MSIDVDKEQTQSFKSELSSFQQQIKRIIG